jgi:NADPH2:quinone reductase
MKAIQVEAFGGPEVMKISDVSDPVANSDEVLIDVTCIGVNYADTHQIEDSYMISHPLPFIPGMEVAGTLSNGKRVMALLSCGGYSQKAAANKSNVFEIPSNISDQQALASLVQGCTAWHTLKTMGNLVKGQKVLIHAAAGGVGTIAVQLAKYFGAYVVGVTSNKEKADLVKTLGADVIVDPHDSDLRGALMQASLGTGFDLVLEMVGGRRFDISLEVLAPFGRLVSYGAASRKAASEIKPLSLLTGSRTISGFYLADCVNKPGSISEAINELFKLIESGHLHPVVGQSFFMSQAVDAHKEMLARKTMGKITLDPHID